jgi:hypothetical protein
MAKNIVKAFKILDGGDMSGNLVSSSIPCERLDNIAIQLQWTGTPVGDFFVDARIDEDAPWTELDLDPAVVASGAASDWIMSFGQTPYSELRLRYQSSSGSGALTAWARAKQIGG